LVAYALARFPPDPVPCQAARFPSGFILPCQAGIAFYTTDSISASAGGYRMIPKRTQVAKPLVSELTEGKHKNLIPFKPGLSLS
jgi:hypothetical protein